MQVRACFAVPVYNSVVPSPSLQLIQEEFRHAVSELDKTNSFKYHEGWNPGTHQLSDTTFSDSLMTSFNLTVFKKELDRHVKAYISTLGIPENIEYKILSAWITKTNKNEYSYIHNHGTSDISGVYYYKTNGKDGNIGFRNNMKEFITFLLQNMPTDIMYEPEVGKIILFPGWMDHYVQPNLTNNERISVSFNIAFKRPEFK